MHLLKSSTFFALLVLLSAMESVALPAPLGRPRFPKFFGRPGPETSSKVGPIPPASPPHARVPAPAPPPQRIQAPPAHDLDPEPPLTNKKFYKALGVTTGVVAIGSIPLWVGEANKNKHKDVVPMPSPNNNGTAQTETPDPAEHNNGQRPGGKNLN